MNRPSLQSTLIKALSDFFQSGKPSPKRIALLALGLIGLLYTVLLIGLNRTPMTTSISGDNSTLARQEAELSTAQTSTASSADDALGETFLSEYERFAGEQPSAEEATVAASTSPSTGSWVGTLTFSLLIVIGLAYAGIWGFKQFTLHSNNAALNFGSKQLSVQETQILGPNQKLHLVRMGQEILLIGATDHAITCLARYDADLMAEGFDEHLQVALRPQAAAQSVPLQESLEALRKVQHRGRGGDHA
jgi:flagellar biosynthetic protein FliO